MIQRLFALRWRLARRIAPVPIIAAPGDGKVYILIKPGGDFMAWFEATQFDMKLANDLAPSGAEPLNSLYPSGTHGTFSGTVGSA